MNALYVDTLPQVISKSQIQNAITNTKKLTPALKDVPLAPYN